MNGPEISRPVGPKPNKWQPLMRIGCLTPIALLVSLYLPGFVGAMLHEGVAEGCGTGVMKAVLAVCPGLVNNVNASRGARTFLHNAAIGGCPDLVAFLLSKGAVVNAKTDVGTTPLHYACQSGNEEAVRILLDAGAEVNVKNKAMWTALHFASRLTPNIVRLLLSKGADVNVITLLGDSPLHLAVWAKDAESARLLLDAGADVNAKTANGETALEIAVRHTDDEMIDLLKTYGAK